MSLDTVAGSATRAVGPLLGGTLFAFFAGFASLLDAGAEASPARLGALGALAVSALLHGAVIVVARGVPDVAQRTHVTADAPAADATTAVDTSVLHALRGSILVPVFVVTVLFNLFAYPLLSLVPLLGKTLYALSPAQIGLLVSIEGMASTLSALLLVAAVPHGAARRVFTIASALYAAGGLGLAYATTALPAALALGVMGFALAAFASMQSALVLTNSPPGQARRMMGVLSMCIGTGPAGYFGLGLLADAVGTALACTIGAGVTLAGLLAMVLWWPGLLEEQPGATHAP